MSERKRLLTQLAEADELIDELLLKMRLLADRIAAVREARARTLAALKRQPANDNERAA